jgi:hypothetical protein
VENEQVSGLGNIAEPGSWIQFLISPSLTPGEPSVVDSALGGVPTADSGNANLVFGWVPSTIDDMPQQPSDPSDSTGGKREKGKQGPQIEVFDGFFGAQSEAGIFIHGAADGFAIDSKIDIPYSKVICSGNAGVVRSVVRGHFVD